MKRILKLIAIILAMFLSVETVGAMADDFLIQMDGSDPLNKTRLEGSDYLPGTKAEETYFKISTSDTENKILYCTDGNKSGPVVGVEAVVPIKYCEVKTGNLGKKLAFVYENGYGLYQTNYTANEYLTGDWKQDYYITQVAIWYFTIPPTWVKDGNNEYFDFKNGTFHGESNEITKKISKLVNDAEAASVGGSLNLSSSSSNMNITSDQKYYISNPIKIDGKYLNSKVNISITSEGLNGAFVTSNPNANSGETSFNSGSNIYIKVPVGSVTSTTSKITLNATATTAINDSSEAIECRKASSDIQPVMIFYPNNTTLTASTSVSISKLPVKISKQDITGGEEIPGANLTIKRGSVVIKTWPSTTEAETVYLEPGTYTLEETISPAGYIKSTNTLEFTLNSDGKVLVGGKEVTEVVMTNEPIIVTISKRSITGSEELVGATLRITDKEGNIAKDFDGNDLEWVSEEKPKEFHLTDGTYFLTEIIAPEGYELSDNTIEFTVTKEGKVLINDKEVENNLIVFENTPEPEPVPTGDIIMYVSITLAVVALGVVVYILTKEQK